MIQFQTIQFQTIQFQTIQFQMIEFQTMYFKMIQFQFQMKRFQRILDGGHEAILLLLEEYRQQEQDMYLGKISHKKIWEQIAQILNKKGYMVTGRQCCTRVNTMKRTYKSVKDFNKKSGNGRRDWKYFDVMESLLGDKPYMEPLCTLSSTGAETIKGENPNSFHNFNIPGKSSNVNISVSRKRKANDLQALESRKIDEQKERRHKEKMEAKNKLLEKLDKLIINCRTLFI